MIIRILFVGSKHPIYCEINLFFFEITKTYAETRFLVDPTHVNFNVYEAETLDSI